MTQSRCNLHAHLIAVLLVFVLLLSACSGSDRTSPDLDEPLPSESETAVEALGDEGNTADEEMGMDISGLVDQELPPGFPSDFPIPPNAEVSSTISLGADEEFRVYFAILDTLEKTIIFYESELPTAGWTIGEQKETANGYQFDIENPTYGGELQLVGAETGVALDVHLFPLGFFDAVPDLAEGLGESNNLGDSGSSFPSDFPIPSSYTAIELNDTLRAEGYELAFTYGGIAEMGMIDFNIALMSVGWEMGEPTLDSISGVLIVPFENLGSGFAGYAFITNNPGQFNLDTGGAVLIALAPGQP